MNTGATTGGLPAGDLAGAAASAVLALQVGDSRQLGWPVGNEARGYERLAQLDVQLPCARDQGRSAP